MEANNGSLPIKSIDTWKQFEKEIARKKYRNWVYRGQSEISWKLESSFYRLINNMQIIIKAAKGEEKRFNKDKQEEELIWQFQSQAHLFLNRLPELGDKLEWLSIMQHYGTPTRLLDMTFSPYIAAFFALEGGHDDCCVYAFDILHFEDVNRSRFNGEDYKKEIFEKQKKNGTFFTPYEPKMKNERLAIQQGLFIIPNNYETFDNIVTANYDVTENVCVKYILSKRMRVHGLQRLRLMNINSATLFPGIDGFCRSLKFQVLYPVQRLKKL